ncbi:MAG TPA: RecQ family ATP-dependent DNA helicase [Acidimicrobiia bacterium]|nr:RecQ family ATP-dependent DNA helicase [Acidimicrobiia bacterium]
MSPSAVDQIGMHHGPAQLDAVSQLLRLWEERFGALPVQYRRQFLVDPAAEALTLFPLYRICEGLDRFGPKLRTVLEALRTGADRKGNSSPAADTLSPSVNSDLRIRALELIRALAGNQSDFRSGQWEAIEALVANRRRVLVVQRTGWGKSAVYLIATRLLRDQGMGPTLIVSPLLALMRNQIDMANRAGVRAETINSTNLADWAAIEERIGRDEVDLLLVAPERLNNQRFVDNILPGLLNRIGLLVVDEVHCISDWGHDFRPDYRLLARVVEWLPPNTPILGTTATANDRVVADVLDQFGSELMVVRGTLDRESLALQVIDLPDKADRLAWLAQHMPGLAGSGIIYCLTIRDAGLVGSWLATNGIDVAVYTGQSDTDDRLDIEEELSRGELKAVVATSALGMGYDNPFIEFVIHFQSPGSPIFYYQQVGRAGRATDNSLGVLLTGAEDRNIQDYFIESAFPSEEDTTSVLEALARQPMSSRALEEEVNLQHSRIVALLKILEVEGAIQREGTTWHRSPQLWTYPRERVIGITRARRQEQEAMIEYTTTDGCLMQFLRHQLDDRGAGRCGRCSNCVGLPLVSEHSSEERRLAANAFLSRSWLEIPMHKQWPSGLGLPSLKASNNQPGRTLSRWNEPGWGRMVAEDKYGAGQTRRTRPELIAALAEMVRDWDPQPAPEWVTCIPDRTARGFVTNLARDLAEALELPFVGVVKRVEDRPPQKMMNNRYQQVQNLMGAFEVEGARPEPALLVDDIVDSGWTLTYVGMLLRSAGTLIVYPVALADTSRGGS